jgi:hypothetical protein
LTGRGFEGFYLQTNGKNFGAGCTPEQAAALEEIVAILQARALIRLNSGQTEVYTLTAAGFRLVAARVTAGSVNVTGNVSAGHGTNGPGGNALFQGGTGSGGANGGAINLGPGEHRAGDGGPQGGKGGDFTVRGGDAIG